MNNSNVKIRQARECDYEAVNTLYHDTYSLYHQNLPQSYKKTPIKILLRGTFFNILEDKEALFLVAEVDPKIVGMLYATIEDRKSDEVTRGYHRVSIDEISVLPKYAKQGIGTLLMREAEKWTARKGIKDMTVLVYSFNKNAIAFYEKNDFVAYSIQLDKKIQ